MGKIISFTKRVFTALAKQVWLNRLDNAAVRWMTLEEKASKQKKVVNELIRAYNQRFPDDKI